MTTSQTQVNCPQCSMPIAAEIQQVFDLAIDPAAKQKLLTGQFNIAQCPQCGFNGNLSTPMVYHDHEKELLLTFIPPNLNLPRDEQEKTIGKMINKVIDSLPQEQRKGYLFNPHQALTLQGLIERILQEDGVSKEMLDRQKERMELLQRLATITDEEALAIVTKEEDKNIDEDFFRLISQLIEASMAQGDQQGAQQLGALQQKLLPLTTVGKELKAQSEEVEAAMATLQEAGEGLNRERLLELVLDAPNATRINAYASLARPGMDYEFFQQLSVKIEAAEGDEKARLESIREQLLEATHEIDEQTAQRMEVSKKNVDLLLDAEDIKNTTLQNLQVIDEYFMQALEQKYQAAKTANELDVVQKIEVVIATLQEANQAAQQQGDGPDPEFIQSLLDAPDEAREQLMKDNADKIDEKLVEMLTGLLVQLEQTEGTPAPEQQELTEKVRKTYRLAVRMSMAANIKKANE